MPQKVTFVQRKGNCECFKWTYESSQPFLSIPDQSETKIKVRETFSSKLFPISESLPDPLEAIFGSQVKNPCIIFSNKKQKQT